MKEKSKKNKTIFRLFRRTLQWQILKIQKTGDLKQNRYISVSYTHLDVYKRQTWKI